MSLLGLKSQEHDICLRKQIDGLSIFYVLNLITDFILYIVSEYAINDEDVLCIQDEYLLALTNKGSFYLLVYSLTVLIYSFVMWYIFYHLPSNYKLVAYNRMGEERVKVDIHKAEVEDANID